MLRYTQEHEWLRREGDVVTVGITAHAAEQLGDLVFIELPRVGAKLTQGASAAVVESVKAASDIYAPVSGTVTAVNQSVADAPDSINQDAYGAWLFKLAPSDAGAVDKLLDADAYGKTTGN